MSAIVIVPTGTANLASVRASFARLDRETRVTGEPAAILGARHVFLPGVGAFGASMATLRETGAADALRERIGRDLPTMAICVGHQLLFEASAESPGVAGLGIVPTSVGRFSDAVRVPQFGWNEVAGEGRCLRGGFAYFANSYRALTAPGWTVATAHHDGAFVAAMERGNIVGCQFHPELSSRYGRAILEAWLAC